MELTKDQIDLLKKLMVNSARKGNLANSGIVLENGKMIASAESLVKSNYDATAHSERMLVQKVGRMKKSDRTPGLSMVTVVEPCIMCISACSQAEYKEIAYIVPSKKYVRKIPWTTDTQKLDKNKISSELSNPVKLHHLKEYEEEFSEVFEKEMSALYKIKLP